MEARELRIGSYVGCKVSNDSGIYEVCALPKWTYESSQPVMINRCGYETHPIEKLKPIPLSEEWMLKFGFKDDEPHSYINLDEHGVMSIQFDQYRKIISLFTTGAHYYLPEIKYVHQLQNLYTALTGNELEIKKA
jgi:hypothetical protein